MKTLLSSGILGLSLSLFACSGGDDTDSNSKPEPTTTTTAAPATPAPVDEAVEPVVPAVVTPPEAPPVAATPPTVETPVTPALATPVELRWRPCGQINERDVECTELEVPVDYDHPEGEKVAIAMRRVPANPEEPHRGALLFNPGGPGGEGIDFALGTLRQGILDQFAPGFDIIGFDPRGVADSGERACGLPTPDPYASPDTLDSAPTIEEDLADTRATGERCEQQYGALFRKLGTKNVVRDMEELRKALGEKVLNFYGASYGTRLAAMYAHTYPKTTGRMVLDGAVSPHTNLVELGLAQVSQGPKLHEQLLQFCESGVFTCPPNARQLFDQALASARTQGLEQPFAQAWYNSLASKNGANLLISALDAEAANPGGAWITSFVNLVFGGDDVGFSDVAYSSVNCTDNEVEPPTLEQIQSIEAQFAQISPLFGVHHTSDRICAAWPVTRDPLPLPTAVDAPPLLVIGGAFDLRTPYEFAQQLTETLGNATLLTSNHWGHCAIGNAGECVYKVIRAYLTSGSLPATGATCPME